jgi:DNA-binding IclR family transcriptional regulator
MQQLRLDRFTANTITDMGRLEAELERCVEQQIGVDDEEFIAGISCVAVPIYDADGQVLAALAVHAPAVRSPLSRSLSLVPRLQRAAAELANTF